ncbi:NUDIX hydrolase [Patescibacteria group bacterium]|nr:NUDIX hydrolase [Patescibacteria group bacterium]MBU1613050.1 NUDIX hydrolase [Patescibacteria group bacterium]
MEKYNFQYCQKIVVYSKDEKSVLMCKRKGEADFDSVFSFIGGKMETTDAGIVDGLRREKNEEVGESFKIKIFPTFTTNVFYAKKDGNAMILPHFFAIHESGEIELNEEYSEYKWVPLNEVASFEPKIFTIPEILDKLELLKEVINKTESVII